MARSSYQLADDVFMCLSENHFVFLDLRRNQYLCLNQESTQIAMRLFGASSEPELHRQNGASAADLKDVRPIVEALTNRGLLAQDGTIGKLAACVRSQRPERVLLDKGTLAEAAIRPGQTATFFLSSLNASRKLRWYSIERTVRSVRNRKQRRSHSGTANANRMPELVGTYNQLRPYYIRQYLCLYDSLALIEFLAHYRLFPDWVFGVTAEPFHAHCWLQERDCVLNDTVEYVRGFTPIMVV